MEDYNKTQLNPDTTFERHVYHRDQFAHYLRWTHVLKRAKIGMKILDWGCGTANLLEVLYRNRFKASRYLGLDVKESSVKKNREKYSKVEWAEFVADDLCRAAMTPWDSNWDMICSFEVLEHIGKHNAHQFLENIKLHMNKDTILLLSTPCYDEKVGAADNHMINGQVGEFAYDEMLTLWEAHNFTIMNHWGTFASQKDYKGLIQSIPGLPEIFDRMHEYYDSNILSNLMAPLFPEHSRNVLWEVSL